MVSARKVAAVGMVAAAGLLGVSRWSASAGGPASPPGAQVEMLGRWAQGRLEAVVSTGSGRTDARHARMQMLYKANPPDRNPFEKFDKGFAQGKYKKAETDANVFQDFDKGFRQPKYRSLEQQASEENPFEKTPSNYPFDETEGGHVWKHWDGDSPMDALHEFNALDTGAPDEAFKLGDHTLGRPFHEYKPEKNVFQDLSNDDETYQWGATDKSVPDRNVFSALSPDSGYKDEK